MHRNGAFYEERIFASILNISCFFWKFKRAKIKRRDETGNSSSNWPTLWGVCGHSLKEQKIYRWDEAMGNGFKSENSWEKCRKGLTKAIKNH